jgi:hypothetical protein
MIRFDETVNKLEFTNVRIAERGRWRNRSLEMDWDDDSFYDWEPGVDYVMSENGELVNPNKATTTTITTDNNGVYEYKKDSTTPPTGNKQDSLRRVIEERERQLDEDRRRLEEAERRENDRTTFNLSKTRMTAKQSMQVPSPVFSLII